MEEKINFTNQQLKAIGHDRGHLQIVACAGAGKTEIVSRRIAELIKRGVPPSQIVGFTFTEKAAEELKTRIREILDEECPERADFGDMYIGTIHSFCFFMLKELDPSYRSFDVLDEAKRLAFVAKPKNFYGELELVRLQKSHGLKYYRAIERFLYSADIMMMEDINPSKLSDRRFASCFLNYQKLLNDERYLDFSTMIYRLVKMLESDSRTLEKLNQKVKHLVVDEYQDVNFLQERLIELISLGADSVCVVGDDDQCIYQWRGSQIENIVEFEKRYGKKYHVTKVPLEINFRSPESIIHTAREFIKNNRFRLEKKMGSNPKLLRGYEEGDIVHRHFKNEREEFSFIVSKIRELLNTDFLDRNNRPFSLSLGDLTVLVRTNEDAAKITSYLDENGIDCVAVSGSSIFERPEVELAMRCISYVFSCEYENSIPDKESLTQDYKEVFFPKKFPKADAAVFIKKIEGLRKDIERVASKSPKDYLQDGLQVVYHRILNAFGAEDFEFGDVYNYNLAVLSQAISDYESVWIRLRTSEIKGFFFFVYAYAMGHYGEAMYTKETKVDAVKVLTVHKAKGLQFPVVFFPGLVQKRPPWPTRSFVDEKLYPTDRYAGNVEDERRVFYTAITRSEKYLFLTGSVNRKGRVKNYKPHEFIGELDKKYIVSDLVSPRKSSGYPSRFNRMGFFPTSFSELSCYSRCPFDFRLRHVYGYNAGVPVAFGYGTNIHNILNIIHNRYREEKRPPTEREIESLFDRIFKLRYATEKIAGNMKKAGIKIVKHYVNLHKDQFKRILETEKKFEFVMGEALIAGQIDLLKKVDDRGNVTEVEIIDFKTENEQGIYALDHKKQLRFYAIACLGSLGLSPKKACVHHLDKIRDEKEYVDISAQKLEKTKEEIKSVVKSILSEEFTACPSANCGECDYGLICPHKTKDHA